jgi:hypothetical protein
MATNTLKGIGIGRSIGTLGLRFFESDGTVQYKVTRSKLDFLNDEYYHGDLLPFDNDDEDAYTDAALRELRLYWDAGFIEPVS